MNNYVGVQVVFFGVGVFLFEEIVVINYVGYFGDLFELYFVLVVVCLWCVQGFDQIGSFVVQFVLGFGQYVDLFVEVVLCGDVVLFGVLDLQVDFFQ